MEKEYSHQRAWSIGWGWLVAVPAALVLSWAVSRRWKSSCCEPQASAPVDPLDILRVRYAKGEIDKVEFEEKWAAIQ